MGNLNLLFTLIGAPAYRRPALMQSRQEPGKEKSRLSAGLSCSRLVHLRTSDPLADSGRVSGSDPAAAGQASDRRPAAGRASGSDSGSAGPDSGSGSTSK